jgi:hypothetical protein
MLDVGCSTFILFNLGIPGNLVHFRPLNFLWFRKCVRVKALLVFGEWEYRFHPIPAPDSIP